MKLRDLILESPGWITDEGKILDVPGYNHAGVAKKVLGGHPTDAILDALKRGWVKIYWYDYHEELSMEFMKGVASKENVRLAFNKIKRFIKDAQLLSVDVVGKDRKIVDGGTFYEDEKDKFTKVLRKYM